MELALLLSFSPGQFKVWRDIQKTWTRVYNDNDEWKEIHTTTAGSFLQKDVGILYYSPFPRKNLFKIKNT